MVLQINIFYTVPFTLSIAKRLPFSEMNCTDDEEALQTSVKSNSFEALIFYPFVINRLNDLWR